MPEILAYLLADFFSFNLIFEKRYSARMLSSENLAEILPEILADLLADFIKGIYLILRAYESELPFFLFK
jgi:hypothetical protein